MERNLPSFQELLGKALENGIMDPTHVMALVKLPDGTEKGLEALEKAEVDLSSKSRAAVNLAELATTLRMKHGYSLDTELVAHSLFHLTRGLNLHPWRAVAHYWPHPSPVIFVMEGEVALVVAPRVE